MSSSGGDALKTQSEPILKKLSGCRQRLIEARERGKAIAESGDEDDGADREWHSWNQSLPPIAFEIARETKELVQRVDIIDVEVNQGGGAGGDDDDYS
jgi:hypothetical protein